MIVGLGTDVVECERIRRALARHGERFLRRIYTDAERAYCMGMRDPVPHLAARFAAKEATRKALARAPALDWHDVELRRDARGPVSVHLGGRAAAEARDLGVRRTHVSVAHERGVAVATVILEGD